MPFGQISQCCTGLGIERYQTAQARAIPAFPVSQLRRGPVPHLIRGLRRHCVLRRLRISAILAGVVVFSWAVRDMSAWRGSEASRTQCRHLCH